MDRKQKILTTALWAVLVLAMVGIVGAGLMQRLRQPRIDLPVLFDAARFSLTDQEGRNVSSEQLAGRPYVATFIFTHCSGVCPMITQKMAGLQKAVTTPDVKLVSFTVDPVRDTPEVLKEYATRFNADASRWHFLTGTQEQLNDVARSMKVEAVQAPDGTDQFVHSQKFFLVDGVGQVRGLYTSSDEEDMKKLAIDAAALADFESKRQLRRPL